jgi:hypothetical protein
MVEIVIVGWIVTILLVFAVGFVVGSRDNRRRGG